MQERNGAAGNPSDTRSADIYIDAVNSAIAFAEMAIPPLKMRGGKIAVAAGTVETAVPYIRAATVQLPKIAPAVAPIATKVVNAAADKVPEAVGESANRVADAAKGAAGALSGAVSAAQNTTQSAMEARAQKKARELARKTLLDGAGIRLSADKFLENWDIQAEAPGDHEGYLPYPGCYVVITCDGPVRKDDYSRYRELYVGKSEHMGAAIHDDFTGRGNPDVYADVKYKQHVYVLLYPCEKDRIDGLEASLITALDADGSYNRSK